MVSITKNNVVVVVYIFYYTIFEYMLASILGSFDMLGVLYERLLGDFRNIRFFNSFPIYFSFLFLIYFSISLFPSYAILFCKHISSLYNVHPCWRSRLQEWRTRNWINEFLSSIYPNLLTVQVEKILFIIFFNFENQVEEERRINIPLYFSSISFLN